MSKDAVKEYYAAFGEREWTRLMNPDDGAVEFAVTCAHLAANLPKSGRILDIGGGPGRYTIWLAQRGYRVVLADLSPNLLAIARTKIADLKLTDQIESISEADACDLSSWPDASFDAVLSLGPFYHLPDPKERKLAASELVRVLRQGGVAFVAFMPRYSLLRRTLAIPDERHRVSDPVWVSRLLRDGVFENDISGRFTHAYGADPSQIAPFFEQYGLTTISLNAAEGVTTGLPNVLSGPEADDRSFSQTVLQLVMQTASDPSILGLANHLLYVGQKIAVGPPSNRA